MLVVRSKNSLVALLATTGVLLAGAFTAVPAQARSAAGAFGTLSLPPKVVANGSKCASVEVSFTSNGKLEDWQVTLHSEAPNSTRGPSITLTEAVPAKKLTFCTDRDPIGTYEFWGGVSGHLIGQNSYPRDSLEGSVRFSVAQRAASKVTVTAVRSKAKKLCPFGKTAHCTRVVGKVVSAGKPQAWDWVDIQVYRRKRWIRETSARTDGLGRVTWHVTITKKERHLKFRLYFHGNDLTKPSASRAFAMRY